MSQITRKTNYKNGQLLRLVDNGFNHWEVGSIVTVRNSDNHQYHVRSNDTGNHVWVYEHQVQPVCYHYVKHSAGEYQVLDPQGYDVCGEYVTFKDAVATCKKYNANPIK